MKRDVHAIGVMPIPRGHEVEVTVFAEQEGVFSKSWVPRATQPLVVDHTDAVTYGHAWHYEKLSSYVSGEARPNLSQSLRSDLKEHERFRGVLVSSRIVRIGSGDPAYPQTTLVIDDKK
jgi:hypothetical protein